MEEGDVGLCQRKNRSDKHHLGAQKHNEENVYRQETNVLEHISENHMKGSHLPRKSYFISDDVSYVFQTFVQDTMNRPDKSFQHRKHRKRGVRQKTFSVQVGIHGRLKVPCHTVTVIYDIKNNDIITAFPTI